jgi:tRNA-dihydrouridine synthase B
MLAESGHVAGLSIHPRHASQRHAGSPDYTLFAQLVEELPVPVLLSGGLWSARGAQRAFEQTGAAAVLIARGGLGNPWIFAELTGAREPGSAPTREEIITELAWVMDRAVEHMGAQRAGRYLRKFYPWYVELLGGSRAEQKALQGALQQAADLDAVRALLAPVPA